MRILRIAAVVLFVAALALNLISTARYKAKQDTNPPVIESQSDHLMLSVSQGEAGLLQGLTARDPEDGDLTDSILVASTSYFLEKGTINASYVVFDGGHNAGTYSRKVTFTDYVSPRFSLSQPLVFDRAQNIRYLNYIQATDCLEGDITGNIKVVSGEVSNYTVGIYPVMLEVSNSYGDRVQVQVCVAVRDPMAIGPEIALSSYITYVPQGGSFDPADMILSVRAQTSGQSIDPGEVDILGSVDTDTPGSYLLTYVCTHEGREGQAYLTVVVEET